MTYCIWSIPQSTMRGVLYPTMQCIQLDHAFPVDKWNKIHFRCFLINIKNLAMDALCISTISVFNIVHYCYFIYWIIWLMTDISADIWYSIVSYAIPCFYIFRLPLLSLKACLKFKKNSYTNWNFYWISIFILHITILVFSILFLSRQNTEYIEFLVV